MPTYQIELEDGRAFEIDADSPPSEQDIMGVLGGGVGFDARTQPNDGMLPESGNERGMTELNAFSAPLAVVGKAAAGVGNFLNEKLFGYNPKEKVMRFGGPGVPSDVQQSQEQGNRFEGGQTVFRDPAFAQPFRQDIAINRGLNSLWQGMTTPEGIATAGTGLFTKVPGVAGEVADTLTKLGGGSFLLDMLGHAPESTKQAAGDLGTYVGTPEAQRTEEMKKQTQDAVINEVFNKLFLGAGALHLRDRTIYPEVLPPSPIDVVGVNRQLEAPQPSVIDLEQVGGPRGFYRAPENLTQIEGPKGLFVTDPLGQTVDMSQLTPKEQIELMRGPRVYNPLTEKKGYTPPAPVIETPEVAIQNALKSIEAKLNAFVQAQKPEPTIVPANQALGTKSPQAQLPTQEITGLSPSSPAINRPGGAFRENVVPSGGVYNTDPNFGVSIPEPTGQAPYNPTPGPGRPSAKASERAALQEGMTQPSGMYTGNEPIPYAKEGQYPAEGGPTGTLSNLQRERIDAGKENVRAMERNNPPGEPPLEYRNTGPFTKEQQDAMNAYLRRVIDGAIQAGKDLTFEDLAKIRSEATDKIRKGISLDEVGGATMQSKGMGNDAASLPAREKMISGEGQNSGMGRKAAQIKDGKAVSKSGSMIESDQTKQPSRVDIQHLLGNAAHLVKQAEYAGDITKEQSAEFQRRGDEIFNQIESDPTLAEQAAKQLREEVSPRNLDPKYGKRTDSSGNLYGGIPYLDPKFWKDNFGEKSYVQRDAKQLYNFIRNKLGAESAKWKALNTPEFQKLMLSGGTKSVDEVVPWVRRQEEGYRPALLKKNEEWWKDIQKQTETHSYGMEGKVSEAKKEYDELEHWVDGLDARTKQEVRTARSSYFSTGDKKVLDRAMYKLMAQPANAEKAIRYAELYRKGVHVADPSQPTATRAYEQVSALPTDKNVQRVDVVIPTKGEIEPRVKTYQEAGGNLADEYKKEKNIIWQPDNLHENFPNTLGWAMIQYKTHGGADVVALASKVKQAQKEYTSHINLEKAGRFNVPRRTLALGLEAVENKNLPDYEKSEAYAGLEELINDKNVPAPLKQLAQELHDAIDNEPKKIAVIAEAQSRWGQEHRKQLDTIKVENKPATFGDDTKPWQVSHQNRTGFGGSGERAVSRFATEQEAQQYANTLKQKMSDATGHPLLRDYNRLILKAAIEQARKEGATHIMVSDAETAMMTEGHDANMAQGKVINEHEIPNMDVDEYDAYHKKLQKEYPEPKYKIQTSWNKPDSGRVRIWDMEQYARPEQEPGMRLNYDTILPKIAEELTGNKGEKVSLGEHKNAIDNAASPVEAVHGYASDRYRKNLIFKNPDGTPKTDVSGQLFRIDNLDTKPSDQVTYRNTGPFTKEQQAAMNAFLRRAGDAAIRAGKELSVEDLAKLRSSAVDRLRSGLPLESGGGIGSGIQRAVEQNKEAGALNVKVVTDAVASVFNVGKEGVNSYSEPLVERLGRLGGPVSKKVSEEASGMVSKQKKYYGDLTTVVDPAKAEVGKLSPASTWLRKTIKVTPTAATSNLFAQQEGTVTVPPYARAILVPVDRANRAIGTMGMSIGTGGVASGKFQRMLNSYGVDVVRRGSGPAWDAWTEGVAVANNMPVSDVQSFFRRWKGELDKPGTDVASMNKINQDFVRIYPKTVTHINVGHAWHEVLIADAFAYLEGAAQRTSSAKAFREVYPQGSGYLEATRKAVQAELKTDVNMNEFDNLIRALQGHPTDTLVNTITAPDTLIGGGARMLGQVVGNPLKSLMLSGNFITNLAEVVSGGPSMFLGYRNSIKAMASLPSGYSQLEFNGAVNRAMMNYAYDPNSPIRSVSRMFSNGVRRVTFQSELNELQEAQAAMSAKIVAEVVRSGNTPPDMKENLVAVWRAMGIEEQRARNTFNNPANGVLDEFERRASAWLTSGHTAMAEKSRLGTSRAFNELFWFNSYPQMTLNQARSVMKNLISDIENGNKSQTKANAKLLGKVIAGRTAQGALTAGIYALVFGGLYGTAILTQRAKDEPATFFVDSLLGGFGGPAAIAKRLLEKGGTGKDVVNNIATLSSPVSVASELLDYTTGGGAYEGLGSFDAAGKFVSSKFTGYKMMKAGMSLWGLVNGDPQLDASKKAFYQWRSKEMGSKTASYPQDLEEDKQFRANMRNALRELENGGDWKKELAKAGDSEKVSRSLLSRTLLKTPEGKPLDDKQIEMLQKNIGTPAVDKLLHHDAMVREVARELGEKVKGESKSATALEQPTGKFAIDARSASQRKSGVESQVKQENLDWLKEQGLKLGDTKPEEKRGKKVTLLLAPEGKKLEGLVAEEYNTLIEKLRNREGWTNKTTEAKQKQLNEWMNQVERKAHRKLKQKTNQQID